jgi:SNF2 family DNA or RNA helicase
MLQGIPVDDLLLTKETEDNLKDLAGNAMSTTVVGACALCALLVGQDALSTNDEVLPDSSSETLPSLVPRPLEAWSEIRVSRQFGLYEELSVGTFTDLEGEPKYLWESFLLDASWSAKMCVSETEDEVLPLEMIAECIACGHTSSKSNAYPPRKYEEHEYGDVTSCLKRVDPVVFRRRLLNVIPMRVSIMGMEVDDLNRPTSINPDLWGDWKDSVRSALVTDTSHPVEFRFTELKRSHEWTAMYESQSMARLEVKISKRGVVWLLFAKPPTRQCLLRKILDRPIARLLVSPFLDGTFSISAGKWQVCIPLTQIINVTIAGVGEQLPSWRSRLGLKGAFENEIQYETLRITLDSSDSTEILELKTKVDGDYKLLPKCGGACGSLRRKIPESGDDDDEFYFYLASNRSTLACDDPYVISHNFHRTDYKEYRDICLELDRSYSPLFFDSGNSAATNRSTVAGSSYGCWLTVQNAMISENHSNNAVVRCPLQSLNLRMSNDGWKSCPELLFATFPINKDDDIVTKCLNLGGAVEVNLSKSTRVLKHVAFALSKWTLPNLFDNKDWLMLSDEGTQENFALLRSKECAPVKPQIKWTLIRKGNRASYIPLEDVKQASIYERALKNRPKPWLLRISASLDSCNSDATASMTIQIGCNVVSVLQRALGLLPVHSMAQRSHNEICGGSTKLHSFEWRIVHHDDSIFNFPKLSFTSNKEDTEALQPPRFSTFRLRKEQLRSLTWMLKQESSTEPFYEEEVAEAVLPCLNWRIEGRVQRPVLVRGGIIADEVGYGKTAITLGLIDSAEAINGQAPLPPSDFQDQYFYTKATLIIVPKHLMGQWPDEVSKFLGKSKNVCAIKDITAYNKLTIADLQSADMVIVSFAVINNETYFTRLARLSGINPENFPNGSGNSRHFATVYADCVKALQTQVEKIICDTSNVYSCIDQAAKSFQRQHVNDVIHLDGKKSIYKNSKKITKGQIPRVKLASSDVDPWGLSSLGVKKNHLKMKCPPLEAFYWRRMVVDEFTYLACKDREHVLEVVSSIHCTFRWFLSGTPKHANFNDISTLAALLGVHLGIDEVLPGVKLNKKYLTNNNNSGLESLSHYLESRSVQWHFRRHKLSQSFLDRFVRQNVAEIDEIPYQEKICMISLPAVERAIYMELETHLKSLEMNCMTAQKSKRKSTGDRESRMKKILEDSDSGEEALLKCCCHFNMSSSFSALETIDDIIALRQNEKKRLEKEMVQSLESAFRQQNNIFRLQPDWSTVTVTGKGEIHDALQVFILDVDAMKSVPHGADIEINDNICTLVAKGRYHFESNPSEVCRLDSNDDDAVDDATIFELKHALRNHMHFVRSLTKELCGRMRSLRYIQNIRQFQLANEVFKCTMCGIETSGAHHSIGVLSCCGHAGCIECLCKYANEGRCIIPDCCARVSTSHIASTDRLGVNNAMSSGRFGRKLTSVVQKVQEILGDGTDDRVIIFCQFDDLKSLVANALDASNIQSLQVKGTVTQQINTITIFQKEIPEKDDPRVLLLKMDDEQSAGLNLTVSHA